MTYDTGAKVVLQGPVTYDVESAAGGYLVVGKLTARLAENAKPQAVDLKSSLSTTRSPLFTIKTPTAIVTDLGTEFGVEVREDGNTVSHVFQGVVEVCKVAANGKPEQPIRLVASESVVVEKQRDGGSLNMQRRKVDATKFVRGDELTRMSREQKFTEFNRWRAYRDTLRSDPSLVAYYDFQQKEGSAAVLSNLASRSGKSLDGTIPNATWTTGSMPGKHALLFKNPVDYVGVDIPGQFDSVTLAAQICVVSLDNPMNALLMSEGWSRQGAMHWQIRSDGALGLAVSETGVTYYSKPIIDNKNLNRWIHVAVVYDRAALKATFYLNGRRAGENKIEKYLPIQIGPAWIGQWNPAGLGYDGNRNFHGRIEEMVVFGRALKDEQIRELCEAGSPSEQRQEPAKR